MKSLKILGEILENSMDISRVYSFIDVDLSVNPWAPVRPFTAQEGKTGAARPAQAVGLAKLRLPIKHRSKDKLANQIHICVIPKHWLSGIITHCNPQV